MVKDIDTIKDAKKEGDDAVKEAKRLRWMFFGGMLVLAVLMIIVCTCVVGWDHIVPWFIDTVDRDPAHQLEHIALTVSIYIFVVVFNIPVLPLLLLLLNGAAYGWVCGTALCLLCETAALLATNVAVHTLGFHTILEDIRHRVHMFNCLVCMLMENEHLLMSVPLFRAIGISARNYIVLMLPLPWYRSMLHMVPAIVVTCALDAYIGSVGRTFLSALHDGDMGAVVRAYGKWGILAGMTAVSLCLWLSCHICVTISEKLKKFSENSPACQDGEADSAKAPLYQPPQATTV